VVVICELTRKVVVDDNGVALDLSNRAQLEEMVRRGLRAQLGVQGLATGLLYVELTFEDPEAYPLGEEMAAGRFLEVPSIPSSMAEAYASAMQILSNLKKIDFTGLEKDVRALLVDTRKQVNAIDLTAVTAEWAKAGKSVTALTESPEIKQTLVNLNTAIDAMKTTMAGLDKQVGPAGEQLAAVLEQAKGTLKTLEQAAANARNFISAQGGLGEEATRTLMQLSEAAGALQRLTEFLERNPSSLITGRKGPQ
jgi:paraquat-inducible protein B